MTFQLYLICFVVALIGWAIHTGLKLKSLQDKARLANVEFSVGKYFRYDWLSVAISFLSIILFLFFIDNGLKWKPSLIDAIDVIFGFIGYTSSDIASRLFSVVNKKINTAIDYKTTAADEQSGNLEAPTPLPEKPKTQV